MPLSDEENYDYSSGSDDIFAPDDDNYDSDDSRAENRQPLEQQSNNVPRPTPSPLQLGPDLAPDPPTNQHSPPSSPLPPSPPSPQQAQAPIGRRPTQQPIWIRVFPPEEPIYVQEHFTVRTTGPNQCPASNTPINYLHLFFSEGLINLITRETNRYANLQKENRRQSGDLKAKSRLQMWTNVTCEEIKKFLAIMIQMGITHRNCIADYWSLDPLLHIAWFGQTMSLKRFEAIHAMIHLTSRLPVQRGQPDYDPWVKVRPVLDALNSAFKRYYIPDQHLSIDESMIGMRNRCSFVQYMPNKRHARYGIKKFEVVDSQSMYVMHISLYSGSDYLANAPGAFTERVVVDLLQQSNLLGKGYNVFTDSYYTKIPLLRRLLSNNTYLTGTVNKRSVGLPKAGLEARLGPQESIYFRSQKLLFVGYKQKPTRKPVYLLTTAYHAEDGVVRSRSGAEARKPLLIDKYNKLMGGVDCKDKSLYHVTCARPTRRYWKQIFFNLFDTAISNAYVLYVKQVEHEKPMPRKNFLLELARSLSKVEPNPAAGDNQQAGGTHKLEHLPGRKLRVCGVCTSGPSKRTAFWCPGCNLGVHKECFCKLQHRWRPTHKGKKRTLPSASDSD